MVAFLMLTLPALSSIACALDVPPYSSPVTDLAKVLTTEQRRQLEQKILDYRAQSSNEIGVLIINSLEGASLEDYSYNVLKEWGIGKKGSDNGALFLAAIADRKARIEAGYGLEAQLTDLECGRIVSRDSPMASHFRNNDYFGGINAVLDGIVTGIGGEYQVKAGGGGSSSSDPSALIVVLFIVMSAIFLALRIVSRLPFGGFKGPFGGGWFSGGSFGGGFGGGGGGGGGFSFGGGSSGGGGASGGW